MSVCVRPPLPAHRSINRRLMELLPGEKSYRHVPVRVYEGAEGGQVVTGLVRAMDEERMRTLQDLVAEIYPERDGERGERKKNYCNGCIFWWLLLKPRHI